MFTVNSVDIWAGDILYLKANNPMLCFLVESFHTANSHIYARGYMIRIISDKCHGVEIAATDINIELIDHVDNHRLEEACYLSISPQYTAILCPVYYTLLFTQHPMKQKISNAPANTFYKVIIVPLIFFTDDTSGNLSKQYNPYESWLMKCAGLSFRDRFSIENIRFIAIVPKKNSAKDVSILPVMVCNIKALEKSVVMFCEKENQYVLIVATVLWIEVNTFCHYELCGLSGPMSLYYAENVITTIIPDAPTDRCNLPAKDLRFQDRLTGSLLELDAFDSSSNTPVKIPHTILLGIEKYMVIHLINSILKSKKDIIQRIKTCLNDYKCLTGLSCKFTRNINHSESYVDRDFKVLLQILSVILITDFLNEPILDNIESCFIELGRLCSLHVINCGSWLNENGQCEKPGSEIATFLQGNNEKKFCFSFFGGSRDFTDNNNTGDIDEERIKNNSFGVFIFNNDSSSRPHIGYVCGSVVTFLELVACTEDDKKNNYAKAILINHHTDLSHLKLVCKLDMHLYCDSFYIVNLIVVHEFLVFAKVVVRKFNSLILKKDRNTRSTLYSSTCSSINP
ncbi:hypothetical protein PHYBLDRAFT_144548 [Phycomyces blakesleeanus NRRL 1555(-)]|uniref:Uncharacterized protein n=1 Tax=Phycomyces blakesleeanus (strain ATCC 8743b / DSM 1359 / FGSC 10004 / NBRC 33097 / NRRL 1555) TaxID=763407 RepID=A0A163DXT0_PHYB8|nr:hypothetical protein PHYBLDRAFT_144548 [Phycomyces blakesleeanus NRRL 1555(-)]OAD74090.1 hypothetical protein PHYBLDRAFT_144548 [Phycomyces blakesleeanus NRRL 1555(-)]|eukprot:XP_018292130.1 hypothetical protein PHYBLDRAFT_144548 [Phycomyces blakesleeanus NRRL 1555(-)]